MSPKPLSDLPLQICFTRPAKYHHFQYFIERLWQEKGLPVALRSLQISCSRGERCLQEFFVYRANCKDYHVCRKPNHYHISGQRGMRYRSYFCNGQWLFMDIEINRKKRRIKCIQALLFQWANKQMVESLKMSLRKKFELKDRQQAWVGCISVSIKLELVS